MATPNLTREQVDALPARVAHVVHALMVCSINGLRYGPFTAAEVAVYDGPEAFTPLHTGSALREARKRGLAVGWDGYWTASYAALDARSLFEERFLRDADSWFEDGDTDS
jgi:hypothetical protein